MTDRKEKEELKQTEIVDHLQRMLAEVFDPHISTCSCKICREFPKISMKQYEVECLIKKHLGHLIDDDTAHDLAIDIANIYEK